MWESLKMYVSAHVTKVSTISWSTNWMIGRKWISRWRHLLSKNAKVLTQFWTCCLIFGFSFIILLSTLRLPQQLGEKIAAGKTGLDVFWHSLDQNYPQTLTCRPDAVPMHTNRVIMRTCLCERNHVSLEMILGYSLRKEGMFLKMIWQPAKMLILIRTISAENI